MISGPFTPTIVPWRLPAPDSHISDPRYRDALARVYGYSEIPRDAGSVALGRERKLRRMRTLLGLQGNPQAHFQTVLVAGTKGKGSMAALLSSILHAAGYRVGRYTQPHLYSHRERIWTNGRYISEGEFADTFEGMEPALALVVRHGDELGPLTTFDVGTAVALSHFCRERVQIAVVEVGVGGANDATNVLEPVLGLIGPVGIDHADTLGPTIDAIARHKAGILRAGIDVMMSTQVPEASCAIREVAHRTGARVAALGRDFRWELDASDRYGFSVVGPFGEVSCLHTPLAGPCQRDNAAVAVAGAFALRDLEYTIDETAIRAGVASLDWPGRFQTAVADPLTIIDGAHNPAAMRALAQTVRECIPNRPITLVVGMSIDKDAHGCLLELAPFVRDVVVTRARHARSSKPERLVEVAEALGLAARIVLDPGAAVLSAWEHQPRNGVTLVAGSLFLAGDVLEWLWQGGVGSSDN